MALSRLVSPTKLTQSRGSPTDSSASRKQAELYIKDNQVYVRDKSSYQNTYVNGRKVRTGTDGTVVNNGDRLQLSEHTVTIRW